MTGGDPVVDPVAARLAAWAERDAAIGLAAEVEQLRARCAEREAEVEDLRRRVEQLGVRVAQLTLDRDQLAHRVVALSRPPATTRAVGLARRVAGRAVRRALGSRP